MNGSQKSKSLKLLSLLLALILGLPMLMANASETAYKYDDLHQYNGLYVRSNDNNIPQPLYYKDWVLLKDGEPEFLSNGMPNPNWNPESVNDFYAIAKTGRLYGDFNDLDEYKYTLNFTPHDVNGVYKLDIKAFYNGPGISFNLDVDFNEEKLEICRPNGVSLTEAELLKNTGSPYKTPKMSEDWSDADWVDTDLLEEDFLDLGIVFNGGGWAERGYFDGYDIIESMKTMQTHFASNSVSRIDDPNHFGDFSINFHTGFSYVNKALNPVDIRGHLSSYELMCPTDSSGNKIGLSLGTVFFKLKPGVDESDLRPSDFAKDKQAAVYLHWRYINPVYGSGSSSFIQPSGADIFQSYNDSEMIPYAANLEINVLGKTRTEYHRDAANSGMLNIRNSTRMDDDDAIQPDIYGTSGVGSITMTKYYKQQGNEIPTINTPDYDPEHPEIPGWKAAPGGELPNTGGSGVYFLMTAIEGSLAYRSIQNLILEQTFEIFQTKKITAAQLTTDSVVRHTPDEPYKRPIVRPNDGLSGVGEITIVGYKLLGADSWTSVTNSYYIIPLGSPYGEYRILVSVADGTEWRGTFNHATGQDEPIEFGRSYFVGYPYNVYYFANGGTNPPETQYQVNTLSLTLSSQQPTRTGYTFLGWTTDLSEPVTVTHRPGDTVIINDDLWLDAVWQMNADTVVTKATYYVISGGYIFGNESQTTISTMIGRLDGIGTLKAYDRQGAEISDWALPAFTGMEIRLTNGENTLDSVKLVIFGSIGTTGTISSDDITAVKKHILGIDTALSAEAALAADVDMSGDVSINDLISIKRHIVGIQTISQLPK